MRAPGRRSGSPPRAPIIESPGAISFELQQADRPAGSDVDGGLRPARRAAAEDPPLVGGELVEDPLVGGVRLLLVAHVARPAQQLLTQVGERVATSARSGRPGRRSAPRFAAAPATAAARASPLATRSAPRRCRPPHCDALLEVRDAGQVARRRRHGLRARPGRGSRRSPRGRHLAPARRVALAVRARPSSRRCATRRTRRTRSSPSPRLGDRRRPRPLRCAAVFVGHPPLTPKISRWRKPPARPMIAPCAYSIHSSSLIADRSISTKSCGRQLARSLGDQGADLVALARLNSGSRNGVSVLLDGLAARPLRWIASNSCAPTATRTRRASRPRRLVDRRPHRRLEHLPRPVAARTVQQEVADVLERHDVVGDDPRVDVRDLVLAAQEEAVHLERPPLARLDGLEDQVHAEEVRGPADDHAEDRQQPPLVERVVDQGDRDPEQEAEDEPEVDHQPQLALADVAEDPDHQRRGSSRSGRSPSASGRAAGRCGRRSRR